MEAAYQLKLTGVCRLAKKYGRNRLEHACMMMKEETDTASYKALCNMLKNNRDLASQEGESISRTPFNDHVRGASAYTSISLTGKEADRE